MRVRPSPSQWVGWGTARGGGCGQTRLGILDLLSAMPIRVVLAEDNYLVREGVRRLIDAQPELEFLSVCDDLASLQAAIEADRPDVVLTDIRMPPTGTDEGLQAAEHLHRVHPQVGRAVAGCGRSWPPRSRRRPVPPYPSSPWR